MRKTLIILGASGSIGSQTLDIIKKNNFDFSLVGFSIGHQTRKINKIIKDNPKTKAICLMEKDDAKKYAKKYPSIKFFSGDEGLIKLINCCKPKMVVNALVGFVGLYPSIVALENNMELALANKEALVVGGELINNILNSGKGKLYPIDSEHSALWKCLKVDNENVDKLIITASGGAFRDLTIEQLKDVTPEDALNHPTWKMGNKITIDCATMVNKSFEVIEAYYLFGYKTDKIDILLHKESMIHSMVKYSDGSFRAEINKPDMRNPIKFAMYEGNIPFITYEANDYKEFGPYHFKEFDIRRYPLVKYAEKVINEKGITGAVYNACNEEAVRAFLRKEIPFLGIDNIINFCMNDYVNVKKVDYSLLKQIDIETREKVHRLIREGRY